MKRAAEPVFVGIDLASGRDQTVYAAGTFVVKSSAAELAREWRQ